jgi:hypothetical protein
MPTYVCRQPDHCTHIREENYTASILAKAEHLQSLKTELSKLGVTKHWRDLVNIKNVTMKEDINALGQVAGGGQRSLYKSKDTRIWQLL